MLSRNSYPQQYIDACQAKVDAQVATYRTMAKAAGASAALEAFEPVFFNNMVLVLDSFFTHRGRGQEGKDGNPLNEVRVLCDSMLVHDDVMTVEKAIKLDPARSVLGLEPGDVVRMTAADFVRLAEAFFAEIESRFPPTDGEG